VVTGTCALATIVALWALHFAASGRLMDRYVDTTTDPILAARRTVNGLLVSVAGLIAVAVGNELVIAHPQSQVSVALSLVLFGGPLLYLLSQTVYLWAVLGTRSLPRLAALAALAVAGACRTCFLPTQPWGWWPPSCSSWSSPSFVNGMRLQAGSPRTGRPDRHADRPARSPVPVPKGGAHVPV
jgi:hypothetical protein